MMVYGDMVEERCVGDVVEGLRAIAARAGRLKGIAQGDAIRRMLIEGGRVGRGVGGGGEAHSKARAGRLKGIAQVDAIRRMLIEAGRLEQGIADGVMPDRTLGVVDKTAEAWLACWRGEGVALQRVMKELETLEQVKRERVRMKVP